MKPIINNVSETTTHTHTKRFKSFLTDEQVSVSVPSRGNGFLNSISCGY